MINFIELWRGSAWETNPLSEASPWAPSSAPRSPHLIGVSGLAAR